MFVREPTYPRASIELNSEASRYAFMLGVVLRFVLLAAFSYVDYERWFVGRFATPLTKSYRMNRDIG